ncbi:hypothetical protein UFOVP419_50 [uncultured Caudovirales phage]|uniref:Uncharacterized protein n=1 Tax=uncultured Caudovirales phage TaxID=2100421 RepID=A0A6J5M4X4_9CAUD|nr:hypothetical protein UFOVP419_50 [uncultured Caudovirales phage]
MSRKVFTAGEVLAAADVNSFLMDQTVMSFAGTAARGSAIPTPVEGMYTHLEDSDRLEFWNGSAWQSPDGLALLASQSFTSATEVIFNSVFSARYQNYILDFQTSTSSANQDLVFTMRSGTTNATSTYFRTGVLTLHTDSTVYGSNSSNSSSFFFNEVGSGFTSFARISFFQPFLSQLTQFNVQAFNRFGGDYRNRMGGGVHGEGNSYDGVRITCSSGNFTGTARLYGVKI